MLKVGDQVPYFEYLEGIKGKNLYDLRQKKNIVIYNSELDLDKYEKDFEKVDTELIDFVQIISKDFCEKFGCDENEDFIFIIDRYGTLQYKSVGSIPDVEDILDFIYYMEHEGCCN